MLENTSVGYIVACISVTLWGVFRFLDLLLLFVNNFYVVVIS